MLNNLKLTLLTIAGLFFLTLYFKGYSQSEPKSDRQTSPTIITAESKKYFRITVIDEETGRGIPLVKLTTLNGIDYYTDSAGVVAFYEPALMNQEVYFYVESHGYTIEKDPLDDYGLQLHAVPGGSATIKMKRLNIAQRLYRYTGMGIYHDSILLGDSVPIKHPLVNALVTGQDSTLVTVYKNKLFWIWGDTGHPRHPLAGNFKVTCGTSLLPENGGLDPEIGIDQTYFTAGNFVKTMAPLQHNGPVWLGSLLVARDSNGKEHLLANYAKIKPPLETVARGMVEFNDEKEVFEEILQDNLEDVIQPNGHPFRVTENEVEYFYFFSDGVCRCKTDYESVKNRSAYESFTCLKQGSKFNATAEQLERDATGKLIFSWKTHTSPIGPKEQEQLIKAGAMKPQERWFQLYDIETGKEIRFHGGSIYWNNYRRRWVMILGEIFGASVLGEIWYAEADTPLGPWVYAQKIVTHNKYSFYNPVQHPHFAKDNDRIIFFEGTYTIMFSGNEVPTPRYEYNQIMYKLELDDKRLFLPVPVYRIDAEYPIYVTGDKISSTTRVLDIPFFAPDRPRDGTIPVFAYREEKNGMVILTSKKPELPDATIIFYALSPETTSPPPATTPLYEFIHTKTGHRVYTTSSLCEDYNYKRSEQPICYVWNNPTTFNPYSIAK